VSTFESDVTAPRVSGIGAAGVLEPPQAEMASGTPALAQQRMKRAMRMRMLLVGERQQSAGRS
jgi:hypothetical protein